MSNVGRKLRGVIGMGITWAAAWAVMGLVLGASSRVIPGLPWGRFFEIFDAPLPALAVPGFVGGVIFALVVGAAGRDRRLDELSLPRVTAWGALGGLLLSLVPAALTAIGLAQIGPDARFTTWGLVGIIAGPFIVLSAACAACTLLIARRSADRGRQLSEDSKQRV